jgi:hypothetical protein
VEQRFKTRPAISSWQNIAGDTRNGSETVAVTSRYIASKKTTSIVRISFKTLSSGTSANDHSDGAAYCGLILKRNTKALNAKRIDLLVVSSCLGPSGLKNSPFSLRGWFAASKSAE